MEVEKGREGKISELEKEKYMKRREKERRRYWKWSKEEIGRGERKLSEEKKKDIRVEVKI